MAYSVYINIFKKKQSSQYMRHLNLVNCDLILLVS